MDAFEREYYEILAVGESGKWKDRQFFYDGSGQTEYICRHMEHNPGDDDIHWHVWKFTYGVNGITRIEGELIGSVTGRAALDWV